MTDSNLQSLWQRHTWQRTPFAPDLSIVQALTNGKTASGAGFSRYDALSRCIGETAEIAALNEGETSDGLAAGPDFGFAAQHALSERLERWALWEWWHGHLTATPVSGTSLIKKLRHGAAISRETSLWALSGFPHIQVMIALSRSKAGAQPMLGFGADICLHSAAQSALIELGLMELNLVHPPANLPHYFKRLNANASSLFPKSTPRRLSTTQPANSVEASLKAANIPFTLHDRSPKGMDITVVKADIKSAPHWAGTQGPIF